MAYQPIENYGLIGDMHTAALVGRDGSIDWLCWPRFDSPSVFGALLDDERGGCFQVAPAHDKDVSVRQMYWPETNILLTRFLGAEGVAEITDFMPVSAPGQPHDQKLVRRVNMVRGSLELSLTCQPAFNYGTDEHEITISKNGACFYSPNLSLQLSSPVELRQSGDAVTAAIRLEEEETVTFILEEVARGSACKKPVASAHADEIFERTAAFWQRWLSQCTYDGRWREMVYRSALTLKLLTYQPTGAIVAAPTCSLPAVIGGDQNYDYRYTWVREASYTVYALLRIGFTDEADAFMDWLEQRCKDAENSGSIQAIYAIDGGHDLEEETLDHLEGYRGSRPVRTGNAAYRELQLDIYGATLDAAYLHNKYGSPISANLWGELRRMVNWICDNWHRKDQGIWGRPTGIHHFVHSKVMCWITIDRGLRLAEHRSFPADIDRWIEVRDTIYNEIMTCGWDEERRTFRQHYEGDALDASLVMMPLLVFLAPDDPRVLQTLDTLMKPPEEGGLLSNSLVYPYRQNAQRDDPNAFPMSTFMLVHALSLIRRGHRGTDYLKQGRLMFEKMLSYTNHLGLFGEEIGPSGEMLGNMPRTSAHISLITAAYNLDKALETRRVAG